METFDELMAKILDVIENDKPIISPRFGSTWKDYARQNFDYEHLLELAYKNGRKSVLLEHFLSEVVKQRDERGAFILKHIQRRVLIEKTIKNNYVGLTGLQWNDELGWE